MSRDTPALFGLQGPGEITIALGFRSSKSLAFFSSFLNNVTLLPISPK